MRRKVRSISRLMMNILNKNKELIKTVDLKPAILYKISQNQQSIIMNHFKALKVTKKWQKLRQ